jgi:hypothetical protein
MGLGSRGFQFDHNHVIRRVAGIFWQVSGCRCVLRLAGLSRNVLRFAIGKSETRLASCDKYRDRGRMAVASRISHVDHSAPAEPIRGRFRLQPYNAWLGF